MRTVHSTDHRALRAAGHTAAPGPTDRRAAPNRGGPSGRPGTLTAVPGLPAAPGSAAGGAVSARRATRVVVVEDHRLLAESLEMAIGMLGFDVRVRVPDAGTTPKSLLAWLLRQRPAIAVLDLDLGVVGDGNRLIAPLTRAGVKVVVLTASCDQVGWGGCLAGGATTVLSKTGPLHEVMAVVRRLADGLTVLDVAERQRLIDLWHRGRADRRDALERLRTLTRREEVVLGHLAQGRAVRQIAEDLVVSEATVRTQVKAVLGKLGVSSQLAAVGLAHHVGWQPPQAAPAALGVRAVAAAQ